MKSGPTRGDVGGWIDASAALAAAIRRAAAKAGEPTLAFCESLHRNGDAHFDAKGHRRSTTAQSIDRSLRRWEAGERVQFDVADRMLARLGLLWWDVWEEVPAPLPLGERGRPVDVLSYVRQAERHLEYVQVRRLFEGEPDQWRHAMGRAA